MPSIHTSLHSNHRKPEGGRRAQGQDEAEPYSSSSSSQVTARSLRWEGPTHEVGWGLKHQECSR